MKKGTTFEDAMARLEEIVAQLDKANLPLDTSLALFGEGAEIVSFCDRKLRDAQLKIETLFPEKKETGEVSQ